VNDPQRYWSLVVLPGQPYSQADFNKLVALTAMPVVMFVGEQDSDWLTGMQRTEAELTRLGGQVTLEVVPNEGHVIHSLSGARLFDLLESFRPETK
jgi:pimeloyl-ACP methyl ester carboxylesterase